MWDPDNPEGSLLCISTPRELDERVREVPVGATTTVTDLRAHLAKSNEAAATCPVTTAIFLRVVAERALEQLHETGCRSRRPHPSGA